MARMERLLEGKVVLVTGGARGIGACICRVLASHGAKVGVNYASSVDAAKAVVEGIVASGGEAEALQGDVRKAEDCERMVAELVTRFGRLDGLVHNAIGGTQHAPFDRLDAELLQNMLDFGAHAVLNTLRAVRPAMREAGGGRVVNIVTELWNMGEGQWSAYLAGKGAMVGMSRSLANELGPEGITVNMVAPGWMVTENVDPESEGSKGFGQSLPLRHHGSADEIGKACVFFLSDLASYVTGTYLPVCGGRVTQMGA
jgi:3-oxoacyl-[acyl-carrier protein] reductase